jgi:type IV pilus assembly protein PilA
MTGRVLRIAGGLLALLAVTVFCCAGPLVAAVLPMFRGYVMRVRASEAPTFLGEIRLREEAYRAAFAEYCPTSPSPAAIPPGGNLGAFDATLPGWAALGAYPGGPVRFRYRVLTGRPGAPAVAGIPGLDGDDFTFVAQAEADLDGDGDTMAFEAYSESDVVYASHGIGGPPLSDGWE